MTDLRLPLSDFCDDVTARALTLDVLTASKEGPVSFIEVPVFLAITGVYDPEKRHLTVPCAPSAKLSHLPAVVQALVCNFYSNSVGERGTIVLLAPEQGASFLLPQDDSSFASEVRATTATIAKSGAIVGGVVAVARGPDAYATLLDAGKILADKTGMSLEQMHSYIGPLLESVGQLKHDTTLAAGYTSDGTAFAVKAADAGESAFASATAQSDVAQSVLEGVVVQVDLSSQVHPLPARAGLVLRQAASKPLVLQYSGMSVVYGAATNHVLAVLDTAAALKMVPSSSLRSVASSPVLVSSSSSLTSCGVAGAESPSAVSAGVSDTTSAAPSPSIMSRSNSSSAGPGDTLTSSLSGSSAAAVPPPAAPIKVISGRSITTAPIVQVIAAPAVPGIDATAAASAKISPYADIPGDVLASFALIGVKSAGAGRDAGVGCYRIMPSSALKAESGGDGISTVRQKPPAQCDLGLVIQAEIICNTSGKLFMFVEGIEKHLGSTGVDDGAEGPVRQVTLDGRRAVWEYDSTGCMLTVDFPSVSLATEPRAIQVYL